MFDSLLSTSSLIGLVTLVLMEIVLGIDNIIFIAILCDLLPSKDKQRKARTIGLSLALIIRIFLLIIISWVIHNLTNELFTILSIKVSWRAIILFLGGVFLIYKTVKEIYLKLRGHEDSLQLKKRQLTIKEVIIQITLIDIVFSFDSILTAVGLSNDIVIMSLAVVISMFVMLFLSALVSGFINKYPTLKILALAFLVCIGVLLVLESFEIPFNKNYIYVAMGFSLIVELLNIRLRKIKHQSL